MFVRKYFSMSRSTVKKQVSMEYNTLSLQDWQSLKGSLFTFLLNKNFLAFLWGTHLILTIFGTFYLVKVKPVIFEFSRLYIGPQDQAPLPILALDNTLGCVWPISNEKRSKTETFNGFFATLFFLFLPKSAQAAG